jgi:repressor LexA
MLASMPNVCSHALTPRQRETLALVEEFSRRNGFAPTLSELAEMLGVRSKAAVKRHLDALVAKGALERLEGAARALGVGVRACPQEVEVAPRLPLLGEVGAGVAVAEPRSLAQAEEWLACPSLLAPRGDEFLLVVRGESMAGDGILDGDYVVVRPCRAAPPPGALLVLMHGDDAGSESVSLKRLAVERSSDGRRRFRLDSSNPAYGPLYADYVDVLGTVVGSFRLVEA